MSKVFKGCYIFYYLMIFLIISNFISITYQKGNLQKNKLLRNLEEENEQLISSFISELPSTFYSDFTSLFSSDLNSTEEETNSTIHFRIAKKKGLSAGGIIGIIAPCVVALGGLGAAWYFTRPNSSISNSGVPANYESSVAKFNSQPNMKEVEVIQQTPIVKQQPIYPIKQDAPQQVKVDQVTTINQEVPTHQIIESQSQLVPGNNAINTIAATSQIVPENSVSQANP